MFFGKLLPREGNFFELFDQHAAFITQAATAFMQLVLHYDDVAARERHAVEVDTAERAADRVTAEVNRLLHTTFITPIGREQIHALINGMDDIVDLLQDATETLALYDVRHLTEDVRRLGEISVKCCERVRDAVKMLSRIADPAVAEAALKTCEEIKLRTIYEHLESISDRCEDVANMIEGVVLENS